MPSFIPIDKAKHRTHGWRIVQDLQFAARDTVVPVYIDEVSKLMPNYLFVFVRHQKETFSFSALQGLRLGQNVYLTDKGKSIVNVIPEYYMSYPFKLQLIQKKEEARHAAVAIDIHSGLYCETPETEENAFTFFTEEGRPSEAFESVVKRLMHNRNMSEVTQAAVDAIAKEELLVPFTIDTKNMELDGEPLKGLYMIDQKKLQTLDTDSVQKLYKAHAFPLAYAQLFSMPRLETLKYLYTVYMKKKTSADTGVVEAFFDSDNETIDIDWSKL